LNYYNRRLGHWRCNEELRRSESSSWLWFWQLGAATWWLSLSQ